MKNFLMIACLAVCTVFVSNSTSYAIGGGKGASPAVLTIENTSPGFISVWVRPSNTPIPATLADLRPLLRVLDIDEPDFVDINGGNYTITTVPTATLGLFPEDTELDQATIDSVGVSATFRVDGVDMTALVDGTGITFEEN